MTTERIVLGVSVALNAVLAITLIIIVTNRPPATPTETNGIAQIETTATIEATSTPADIHTQTPVIITVVATPTAEKVIQITPEIVEEATETAVPTQTPAPTSEPAPTMEPSPTPLPTATEVVYVGPTWLRYVNQFRTQANLPLVYEDASLSEGAVNHSHYMILNDSSSHNEDSSLPGYTSSGQKAGVNGNIAISGAAGLTYAWPIDYWMSAAFHAIPILDPALTSVGYGEFHNANSAFGMTATLDVKSGLRQNPPDLQYPILFPRDGGETWVTTYSLPEFPNTASSCDGYSKPTGAPIILLLGDGENTPRIRETRLFEGTKSIFHCAFDETDYYNSDAYYQKVGRKVLDEQDAVVILPQSPLKVGQEYTVYVNNGGEEIEWKFNVVQRP